MEIANNLAHEIVRALLGDSSLAQVQVSEASVHRPARGRIWIAAFTGSHGGQIWRSTGLTDREQALLVAKKWEADARALRVRAGRTPTRPLIRVRPSDQSSGNGPLTQREVALLLGMSERAVRNIERRAIEKLRRHPLLRQAWQHFLSGDLDEHQAVLTPEEIKALFDLAWTADEQQLVEKILRLVRH